MQSCNPDLRRQNPVFLSTSHDPASSHHTPAFTPAAFAAAPISQDLTEVCPALSEAVGAVLVALMAAIVVHLLDGALATRRRPASYWYATDTIGVDAWDLILALDVRLQDRSLWRSDDVAIEQPLVGGRLERFVDPSDLDALVPRQLLRPFTASLVILMEDARLSVRCALSLLTTSELLRNVVLRHAHLFHPYERARNSGAELEDFGVPDLLDNVAAHTGPAELKDQDCSAEGFREWRRDRPDNRRPRSSRRRRRRDASAASLLVQSRLPGRVPGSPWVKRLGHRHARAIGERQHT